MPYAKGCFSQGCTSKHNRLHKTKTTLLHFIDSEFKQTTTRNMQYLSRFSRR